MSAIEVVDNRYGGFLSIPVPVLIADHFPQSACVLGAKIKNWRELALASLQARTFVNGKLRGIRFSSEVLGYQLEGVVWIANRMASPDWCLEAGKFILSGSLV